MGENNTNNLQNDTAVGRSKTRESLLFLEDDIDDQMKATTGALIEELDKKISLASKGLNQKSEQHRQQKQEELRFFEECQKQLKTFEEWQSKLECNFKLKTKLQEDRKARQEEMRQKDYQQRLRIEAEVKSLKEEIEKDMKVSKEQSEKNVKSILQMNENRIRILEELEKKRKQDDEYQRKVYDQCQKKLRHYDLGGT